MDFMTFVLMLAVGIPLYIYNKKQDRAHEAKKRAYQESVERVKRENAQMQELNKTEAAIGNTQKIVQNASQVSSETPLCETHPNIAQNTSQVSSETPLLEMYQKAGEGDMHVSLSDVPAAIRAGWALSDDATVSITARFIPGGSAAILKVVQRVEVPSDDMPPMWMEAHYGPYWDRGVYEEHCSYYLVTDPQWISNPLRGSRRDRMEIQNPPS